MTRLRCEHRNYYSDCGQPAKRRSYVTHDRTLCDYHDAVWSRIMSAIPVDPAGAHLIADIRGTGLRSVHR